MWTRSFTANPTHTMWSTHGDIAHSQHNAQSLTQVDTHITNVAPGDFKGIVLIISPGGVNAATNNKGVVAIGHSARIVA